MSSLKNCYALKRNMKIHIQNHPSVLILSAVHNEIFPAGALEARVRRTSASRTPAGKTE